MHLIRNRTLSELSTDSKIDGPLDSPLNERAFYFYYFFNVDKFQDFELLRRISGCQEYLTQESFERMWCWLYPVAFTLSRQWINAMWSSLSPKWIEGFITKEEAELSLQSPAGLQDPGTFILRFPTSRSWPHPDAGSLVVTYVGNDYALHHRLLTLDRIFR